MKIIDILNKIANGEQPPKKILYKCNDEEYIFEYDEYNFDYQNEWGTWLFEDICFDGENHLNKEVEILETTITMKELVDNSKINELVDKYKKWQKETKPDKIEKLDNKYALGSPGKALVDKINEIIDHLQE